ncbi:MAG TPA: helix-turn-helix domain-containing protein [Methanosarcina sp.]|nr:helix-turn-helix domain-containing protein [Methanosarcina sp.]
MIVPETCNAHQTYRQAQDPGFPENEAKIYVGLLNLNEATARKNHEFTHVQGPKICFVLGRMKKKGYVEVEKETPACFRSMNRSN